MPTLSASVPTLVSMFFFISCLLLITIIVKLKDEAIEEQGVIRHLRTRIEELSRQASDLRSDIARIKHNVLMNPNILASDMDRIFGKNRDPDNIVVDKPGVLTQDSHTS